jgi:hypothetical protein
MSNNFDKTLLKDLLSETVTNNISLPQFITIVDKKDNNFASTFLPQKGGSWNKKNLNSKNTTEDEVNQLISMLTSETEDKHNFSANSTQTEQLEKRLKNMLQNGGKNRSRNQKGAGNVDEEMKKTCNLLEEAGFKGTACKEYLEKSSNINQMFISSNGGSLNNLTSSIIPSQKSDSSDTSSVVPVNKSFSNNSTTSEGQPNLSNVSVTSLSVRNNNSETSAGEPVLSNISATSVDNSISSVGGNNTDKSSTSEEPKKLLDIAKNSINVAGNVVKDGFKSGLNLGVSAINSVNAAAKSILDTFKTKPEVKQSGGASKKRGSKKSNSKKASSKKGNSKKANSKNSKRTNKKRNSKK